MRVYENGTYRDMTEEEIQHMQQEQEEWEEQQKNMPPTQEERIATLEEALEMILNGVTE